MAVIIGIILGFVAVFGPYKGVRDLLSTLGNSTSDHTESLLSALVAMLPDSVAKAAETHTGILILAALAPAIVAGLLLRAAWVAKKASSAVAPLIFLFVIIAWLMLPSQIAIVLTIASIPLILAGRFITGIATVLPLSTLGLALALNEAVRIAKAPTDSIKAAATSLTALLPDGAEIWLPTLRLSAMAVCAIAFLAAFNLLFGIDPSKEKKKDH